MTGSNWPISAGAALYFYLKKGRDQISKILCLSFCVFEALGDGQSPEAQ
jgi:hypothetical protein